MDLPIDVHITPEASTYIREKGGEVLLRSTLKNGCCGGRVDVLRVEVASGHRLDGLLRIELPGGLALFADGRLIDDLDVPLTIGLDRFLGMRGLYVQSWEART